MLQHLKWSLFRPLLPVLTFVPKLRPSSPYEGLLLFSSIPGFQFFPKSCFLPVQRTYSVKFRQLSLAFKGSPWVWPQFMTLSWHVTSPLDTPSSSPSVLPSTSRSSFCAMWSLSSLLDTNSVHSSRPSSIPAYSVTLSWPIQASLSYTDLQITPSPFQLF